MGLKGWADKQARKADLRRAIEETHFHKTMLQGLAAALRATEFDEAVSKRFDDSFTEYLNAVVSSLRESTARLWGFRGNLAEWTRSQEMIASGKVLWAEDRRERLILAEVLIEDLRCRIEHILRELESGEMTAEQALTAVFSAIESFIEHCTDHSSRVEEEAFEAGLANPKDVTKLKQRAEKRVGSVIRHALF